MHRHSFAIPTRTTAPSQILRGQAAAFAPATGFGAELGRCPARAASGLDAVDSWRDGMDTDVDFVEGGPV